MCRKTLWLNVLLFVLVVGLAASPAVGQAVYGSIFGTVTDQTGAAIPGATVTITDMGKGTVSEVTTNVDGNYTKQRLIPGRYQVKISAAGFKTFIQEVDVRADVASRLDAQLEAGAVTEEITVTAEAPVLKTDRADIATTFAERQVEELPIFERNFTAFQLLTPGTQRLMWQHAAAENPQGSIQIMVNGQHFSGTSFQLDGTDNRDPILGIIVINPTLESVTESKITTQNYDAEFGQALAAVVTAQTKSGTNELHGSAFWFRRNDTTSARNPFTQATPNPLTGKTIPDTLWNQFGGSLGGPIIKNKTFLFGDYQGTRSKVGRSVLAFVPTAAQRAGDLSAFLQPAAAGAPMVMTTTGQMVPFQVNMIFDPTTGDPMTGANRQVFADPTRATPANPLGLNIIPTNRLSAQAQRLLQLLPGPNRPDLTANNFSSGGAGVFDANQLNLRGDHYWTTNFHLFGRYSYARYDQSGPGLYETPGGPPIGGPGLGTDGFAGISATRNHSIAAGFDYTLSSSVITDFRFGFFQYRVRVSPNGLGTTPATDVGIPGLNLDDFSSGMPAFFINGTGSFAFGYGLSDRLGRCNCPLLQDEKQWQWVNNWNYLRGNHAVKFGADIRYADNLRVPSDAHRAGELSFEPARTTLPGVGGGLGLAAFLLGDVSNFSRYVSSATDAGETQHRWFFYGQDTWRVTPKFTFNFGLRWEIYFPQKMTRDGGGGFVDIDTGETLVAGIGDIPRDFGVENTFTNFAPRLGMTFQLTEKTVLRLGYGRSYDIGVFGSIFGHSVTQNLPVLARQNLNPAQNFQAVFGLAAGPPAFTQFFGLTAPPNRGGTPNTSLPSTGRFFTPDGVNPFIQPEKMRLGAVDAWNVTLQHQLTPTLSLEAAYVANKGTHVFTDNAPDYNLNQATLVGFLQGLSTNDRRPFFRRFGWSQDLRYHANDASNNYHSLQVKVDKRLSQGYNFLAHYTWSRSLNFDSDYYPIDPRLNYGLADFDRQHYFVLTNLWELPFGRGQKFLGDASRLVDLIIGGWQINSNTTWASGLPFSPGMAGCGALRDTGPCRPHQVGDPDVSDPSQFGWFRVGIDTSGSPWQTPARGTFGSAGRNSLRGPRFFQTDMSFFKNVALTETVKLQFRAESFNIFNHVNLGNPDSCVNCNPATDGKIFSTAFFNNALQRQWQFALKLDF